MTNWIEELPEELQSSDALGRFDSVESLAQGYLDTKAAGSQSLRVPPAEAGEQARVEFLTSLMSKAPELQLKPTDENREEYFRVLGKPEEIVGYNNPEDTPSIGDEAEEQIRLMALKANLTQEQYQSLIGDMSEMSEATKTLVSENRDTAVSTLKGEWGTTYDERVEAAKKINEEMFPGSDFDGRSNADIKGLYEMSTRLKGTGIQAATQPPTETHTMTPAEAMTRRNEIMARDAYWDATHPEHSELVKKVVELGILAGGTEDMLSMRASPLF